MRVEQSVWQQRTGWTGGGTVGPSAALVLAFGAREVLKTAPLVAEVRSRYPHACIVGCSTAGEISGSAVTDNSLVCTAIAFDHAEVRLASVELDGAVDSFACGERLASQLPATLSLRSGDDAAIKHVFVLSDGLAVNGSELVRGIIAGLPGGVTVTGGMAGDAAAFTETVVLANDRVRPNAVAAVAFYGAGLRIGHGCLGGWDPFGPERVVTRAIGSVLYELDGRSALQLYEQYLGTYAAELPASGLLFPLCIRPRTDDRPVVRAILGIDRERQSITFAGDIPEGSYARLMKANFDRLIDGAVGAAQSGYRALGDVPPQLAILISCVGRKLVLQQRIEEEIDGAREVLGRDAVFAGFYSYGEISPCTPGAKCELHNQTMTITTFAES